MKIDIRPLEEQVACALRAGKRLAVRNASTDGESLWLYTNKVFQYLPQRLGFIVSLAGEDKKTTRKYLNAILLGMGMSVCHNVKKELIFRIGNRHQKIDANELYAVVNTDGLELVSKTDASVDPRFIKLFECFTLGDQPVGESA